MDAQELTALRLVKNIESVSSAYVSTLNISANDQTESKFSDM